MTDRLQAAREALEPFAKYAERYADIPGVLKTNPDVELWQNNDRVVLTVGDLRRAREALTLLQSGPDTSRQSSETAQRIIDAIAFTVEEGSGSDWGANHVIDRPQSITNIESILSAVLDAAAEGQGWPPLHDISTAPKDGTLILILHSPVDGPKVLQAHWFICKWMERDDRNSYAWHFPGTYAWYSLHNDPRPGRSSIKGWMPLPPVSASKPEGA